MSKDKCIKCGNTEFSENAAYCKKCGTPISNYCTNGNCGQLNDEDAIFCEYCGAQTTYDELGILKTSKSSELPF